MTNQKEHSTNYNGFSILKTGKKYVVFNNAGQPVRECKTKKECIDRINSQTV